MKALHPEKYQTSRNEGVFRDEARHRRIPIYRERVEAGLPLFEIPVRVHSRK